VGNLEITDSTASRAGVIGVRRALPRQRRQTVGVWCFADPSPHRRRTAAMATVTSGGRDCGQ
jgi:hypothetical protein